MPDSTKISLLPAAADVADADFFPMVDASTVTTKRATAAQLRDNILNDSLEALYDLTPIADRFAYFTGASTASLASLTSFGRALLAASSADAASLVDKTTAQTMTNKSLTSPQLTGIPTTPTAAANTNTTQVASCAFVTTAVGNAVTGLWDFKGPLNASANPNYPAASTGDAYVISVAGKVGGASGASVDAGDMVVATANNAGGTQASVGTSWTILEHNLAGALLSANNLSDVASASAARTSLGLATVAATGAASDLIGLAAVVQAYTLDLFAPPAADLNFNGHIVYGSTGIFTADVGTGFGLSQSFGSESITFYVAGVQRASLTASGLSAANITTGGVLNLNAGTITNATSLAFTGGGTISNSGSGAAMVGVFNHSLTGLAATSTDGVTVSNTTAATLGATVQMSPRIRWRGSAWKLNSTAASQTHDWILEVLPVSGAASTTSLLKFGNSNNGAGYTYPMTLSDAGLLSITGSLSVSGAAAAGSLSVSGAAAAGSLTVNGSSSLLGTVINTVGTLGANTTGFTQSVTFNGASGLGVGHNLTVTDSGSGTSNMTALLVELIGSGSGNGSKYIIDMKAVGGSKAVVTTFGAVLSLSTGGIGYGTGAGGVVTQLSSRTTSVMLDKTSGAITLVSAAGSIIAASFTVNNSTVVATDTVHVSQKSGTDKYMVSVTAVTGGSFEITFYTTGGTTTEQPVFNFNVFKGVAA